MGLMKLIAILGLSLGWLMPDYVLLVLIPVIVCTS